MTADNLRVIAQIPKSGQGYSAPEELSDNLADGYEIVQIVGRNIFLAVACEGDEASGPCDTCGAEDGAFSELTLCEQCADLAVMEGSP